MYVGGVGCVSVECVRLGVWCVGVGVWLYVVSVVV